MKCHSCCPWQLSSSIVHVDKLCQFLSRCTIKTHSHNVVRITADPCSGPSSRTLKLVELRSFEGRVTIIAGHDYIICKTHKSALDSDKSFTQSAHRVNLKTRRPTKVDWTGTTDGGLFEFFGDIIILINR